MTCYSYYCNVKQTMFHDSKQVQRWSPRCDVTLVDFTALCDTSENDKAKTTLPISDSDKVTGSAEQVSPKAKSTKSQPLRNSTKRKISYVERPSGDIDPDTPEIELSKPNQKVCLPP